MYCFKCGKKLPASVINCPDCDTPQKRRQRYRRRMILGLFIFLAGAVAGSLFDTLLFKGQAWNHTFLGIFTAAPTEMPASLTVSISKSAPIDDHIAEQQAASSQGSFETAPDVASDSDNLQQASVASFSEIASSPATTSQALASGSPLTEVIADNASQTEDIAPAKPSFPDGRLVYAGVTAWEKGAGSNYHGFLSRNGSELVFSSNRLKVNGKNIYQCFGKSAVNGEPVRIFEWPGNVWTPETTPDLAKIVFSSDSTKDEHLFVYDRASKKGEALTEGSGKNMMPAVSPDGKLIVFVSNRQGSNNIWIIGIDGNNLLQITSGKTDDREPRWTADGKSIVFTRIFEPLKKSHIMKIQLEPLGEPQSLVATNHRNWLADLSPDGTMLAYTRSESSDGSKNVLVLREMKTGAEQVIRPFGGMECFRPVWNADCGGFVFHSGSQQGRSLYQANFTRENN